MATWRCPHCLTVQGETSRCFLCGRSATSCGTCANFRTSVVGGVGYCALDKKRLPLSGAEQRPCWTDATASATDGLFAGAPLPVVDPASEALSAAPEISARPRAG
jgi:hypothetical protein